MSFEKIIKSTKSIIPSEIYLGLLWDPTTRHAQTIVDSLISYAAYSYQNMTQKLLFRNFHQPGQKVASIENKPGLPLVSEWCLIREIEAPFQWQHPVYAVRALIIVPGERRHTSITDTRAKITCIGVCGYTGLFSTCRNNLTVYDGIQASK